MWRGNSLNWKGTIAKNLHKRKKWKPSLEKKKKVRHTKPNGFSYKKTSKIGTMFDLDDLIASFKVKVEDDEINEFIMINGIKIKRK